MANTVASFRARFPEFALADFPDAAVLAALVEAATQMNADVWRSKYDQGQLLLAAHILATDGDTFGGTSGGAPLGAIIAERVGDVSRDYAVPGVGITAEERDLLWTKYGIRFGRLKRTILSTPVIL